MFNIFLYYSIFTKMELMIKIYIMFDILIIDNKN